MAIYDSSGKFLGIQPQSQPSASGGIYDQSGNFMGIGNFQRQQKPGGFQGFVQDITSPFLKFGRTAAGVIGGVGGLLDIGVGKLFGNKKLEDVGRKTASEALSPTPQDAGYFGKVTPIGYSETGQKLPFSSALEQAIGIGTDIGSTFAGSSGGVKTVGGRLLKAMGIGGLFGASASMEKGGSPQEVAKNAILSGIGGSILEGFSELGGKAINYLTEKLPTVIYNDAIGISSKIKASGRSPVSQLMNEGIWGRLGTIVRQVSEGMETVESKISDILSKSEKTVLTNDVVRGALERLKKNFGFTHSEETLLQAIESNIPDAMRNAEQVPIKVANQIRSQLDKQLGSGFFLRQAQAPFAKEVAGAFVNELRFTVQSLEKETIPLFKIFSNYITASKATKTALMKAEQKFGLGIKDLLLGGGGELLGGIPGAISAIFGKKLLESPAFETGAATLLKNLGSTIDKLPIDKAGNISKTVLIKAISELFPQITQSNHQP